MKKPKETVSQVQRLMNEWDYEENKKCGLDPKVLGSQSNVESYWKCKNGHKWKAKISNRYNGRGCPKCHNHTSFPEQALFFYVRQAFPDAINSYREIFQNGMELDVYIPSLKTGIEYDGGAWHTEQALEKEKKKYEICKRHGVRLIRLKERREHFDLAGVADTIIPVYGASRIYKYNTDYFYLNRVIRETLSLLGDTDLFACLSLSLRESKDPLEALIPSLSGPKVKTSVDVVRDKNKILENYQTILEGRSLASVQPEVASRWHPTKNGALTPAMFPPCSIHKAWWKGECGHEWERSIAVESRGAGCPYCGGAKALKGFNDLATKRPGIASTWHPTKNGKNKPDMFTFGSGHKAWWLCPKCGQAWLAKINLRALRGCPYCSHEKPIKGVNDLVTLRPDLMKEWDYEANKGVDPYSLMPCSNKIVHWVCSKCGHKYSALINNRNKGTGCPNCAGHVLHPGENDLKTRFPEVAKEWDCEKNDPVKPSDVFPNSNKKYWWLCPKGHSYRTSPNQRVNGDKTGCPYCSGNKVQQGYNDLATTHPDIAKDWHPTLNGDLLPTHISRGYTKKVWFLCPKCGKPYETYIGNKIKGYGRCPYCSSKRKSIASAVYCVETGKSYPTLKDAAANLGLTRYGAIHACCKGKTKTAYGYHFEYRKKDDKH